MGFPPENVVFFFTFLLAIVNDTSFAKESFDLVPTEDQDMMKSDDHEVFQWTNAAKDVKLWGPNSAFKKQTNDSMPWMGMPAGRFPQRIYYEFDKPVIIAKFGFRNRMDPGQKENNPIEFEFVASDNCLIWESYSNIWESLISVANVSWANQDEEKTWEVEKIKRKKYKCYGISVTKILGKNFAAIQDLKFWSAKVRPVEYVTPADGTAYASSEYDNGYLAAKAFGTSGYWCSKADPEKPVRLWFQFNEPKIVSKIKFEQEYKLASENGYEVFGSVAVGDCGNIKNQTVLATFLANHEELKNGKEFDNQRYFHCYGIQTYHQISSYVGFRKVMFGVAD